MIDRRRAVLAGIAALPLLVLSAACNDDASGPFSVPGASGGGGAAKAEAHANSLPGADDRGATSVTVPSPSADGADELTGIWSGHYVCNQGPTNMKLVLAGAGSRVSGTFEFSPLAGTNNPSGSYTVNGTLTDGQVTLYGDQWIKQPGSYTMVSFKITAITPTMLRGDIDSPGCTTFQVSKQN
jgi:hypothetical protein